MAQQLRAEKASYVEQLSMLKKAHGLAEENRRPRKGQPRPAVSGSGAGPGPREVQPGAGSCALMLRPV